MLPIRCAGTAACGPGGTGLETENFIFTKHKILLSGCVCFQLNYFPALMCKRGRSLKRVESLDVVVLLGETLGVMMT